MFTKWEVPLRMEKGQCGWLLFSKKKKRNKYRTIAPFLYCLFQAKYFKGNYMTVRLDCLLFFKKKKNNFMAPFCGWGSTVSRPEPFRGGSLLFITKFPKVSGTLSTLEV